MPNWVVSRHTVLAYIKGTKFVASGSTGLVPLG